MMKQAISMRCTEAQFNEVRPELEALGCEIEECNWETFTYLTNNHAGEQNNVCNINTGSKLIRKRKVYEEWNKEIFLEACGKPVQNIAEQLIGGLTESVKPELTFPREMMVQLLDRRWDKKTVFSQYNGLFWVVEDVDHAFGYEQAKEIPTKEQLTLSELMEKAGVTVKDLADKAGKDIDNIEIVTP